ncbi:7-methylguanosine phosphate-specific 5'-nucleotidase isoform X1 [Lutzomyia longipalpis]|uniref:7-methylguanosine phosphate-specific 5'-nucleotidase isoform X1 n=2 Tax=Lutzomyia longipalpis TaxID=7200 RepID=UPI0024835C6E|nr:7-methylguanosine phosphate-specific 5'-nucleotidase isoform X1 [Lutzomyia longipalpis]
MMRLALLPMIFARKLRNAQSCTMGTREIRVEDIDVLCSDSCKIKDPARVERMLKELVAGGTQRLQVVTDFDHTITKQKLENGQKVLTSFGIFDECKSLPQNFRKESRGLYEKYRPIEVDPTVPMPEKIQAMIEWWRLSNELLKGFKFEAREIDDVAVRFKDALRDGTQDLFSELNRLQVPVLVFSAGLGDSVVAILRHASVLLPNVKVVSNFLQYQDGILNGFQEKFIHAFNKNETALEGTEYYDLVHSRDHVILMGDSLGDAGMADGIPKSSHVLKIGFLFDHVEQSLPKYMDTFDIVLIDDQTMRVPQKILSLITQTL